MNVLLVCYAGMSTSLLAEKLEDEGTRRGIDISVSAVPLSSLEENLEGVDCVLLGPQVRFAESDARKAVGNNCPLLIISPQDFGMMKADHVIDQIEEAI